RQNDQRLDAGRVWGQVFCATYNAGFCGAHRTGGGKAVGGEDGGGGAEGGSAAFDYNWRDSVGANLPERKAGFLFEGGGEESRLRERAFLSEEPGSKEGVEGAKGIRPR